MIPSHGDLAEIWPTLKPFGETELYRFNRWISQAFWEQQQSWLPLTGQEKLGAFPESTS